MKLANPFSMLTEGTVAEIVRRLVEGLGPRAIYLFGSHATGVPQPDSDIDIMVIVEDESIGVDLHRRAYAAIRGIGLPVELHFCGRNRFERYAQVFGTLQHEICMKGVLLHAAET